MQNRSNHRKDRARGARRRGEMMDLFESALLDDGDSAQKPKSSSDRKTLQLCKQVERSIAIALAGQHDELLSDLRVDGVTPMGSASHMLVRVIVPEVAVSLVMERLQAKCGALRAEVATSISRKRVPGLSFIAIAAADAIGASEVGHE